MTTHVHFHDFLDKPFEEAKHKRSHGKFAKMSGGGAQAVNPGLKETKPSGARPHPHPQPQARTATWTRQAQEVTSGAAARIARAVAAAKAEAGAIGKEAFAVPHDVETLTKGLSSPNTPMRVKLGQALAKNIPAYLAEMVKEVPITIRDAGTGLGKMAQGLPMSDHEAHAWKAIGRKVVISTLMRSLDIAVPGAGLLAEGAGHLAGHLLGGVVDHVTQHVLEHVTQHIVDHAAEEHALKLSGGVTRALVSQRGDSVFHDASDQECQKLVADWMQTLAKSMASAPIDMQKIAQSAPKKNGDSGRFGPLFGGLPSSGNRLGDEGTSQGAKKGWQKRLHGKSELHKATPPSQQTPPAPKPTFEEMRAKRDYIPPPPAKPPRQSPKQTPTARRSTERKGQAPPGLGYKTQASQFVQGQERSEKSRTSRLGSMPVGQQMSMTQRGREGPGAEQRAATAKAHREELAGLQQRHKAGGSLSEKEQGRMQTLTRIYGSGGTGTPTARGTPEPPKRFLRSRGGRRWIGR